MTIIPPLTPYLVVSDAAAAVEFYKKAFAATQDGETHYMPGTQRVMHARVFINGALVMLADDFSDMMGGPSLTPSALGGTPITLALQLDDLQPLWDRAVAAGATVTMPLADQFWGDRYGIVTDPFGHKWSMSQTIKQMTDQEMKETAQELMAEKGSLMADPI